jgi:hypothetical protein
MSDLEQDMKELSAQYDAELEAVSPTLPTETGNELVGDTAAELSPLDALQQRYDQLLKTKDEFERLLKHQMCIIRFMGETAESVGIDFRDFPQEDYFNGNK